MTISLRLRRDFQLVHEPLIGSDAEIFEEEERVAQKLRERLKNSTGGTFLITGFRGVGKTTAVHQALRQLAQHAGSHKVISVTVPMARPTTNVELMFEVMRRLVERLSDAEVLNTLSPDVRDRLLMAYARTSMTYNQTSTNSEERSRSVGIGGPVSLDKAGVTLPFPQLSSTRTSAESLATGISFLAYSDADVEHDFLHIVNLLGREDAVQVGRLAKLLRRVGIGSANGRLGARIVVLFDEIDKLTEADGGLDAFDAMLGSLKNLLAASGVHFVFVAGVDLHDEWLRESATANSLYRSVFAWQGYVGCSWRAAELIIASALPDDASDEDRELLTRYLEYRGRGIIRNVLYELNELVDWDSEGPYIEIEGTAEERVTLLGELSAVVNDALRDVTDSVLAAPSDSDRLRQAAYFTVDWVLRAGADAFTVADVLDPQRGTPLDQVLQPSAEVVHTVLSALVESNHLEKTVRDSDLITQGPGVDPYPEQYSLSHRLLDRLTVIARSSPRARAEFGRDEEAREWARGPGGEPRKAVQKLVGDRYEVIERLGQGGFGTVWTGFDARGEKVALKVVRTGDPSARARVLREREILERAHGPGVVDVIELIDADDRTVLVTELVEGESLAGLTLPSISLTMSVVLGILSTLERLHARQIVHADIKPSNVIVRRDRWPVLIDLGTARWAYDPIEIDETRDAQTVVGASGTPAYMAPELFLGEAASERSDIWAVGILLLELITGRLPLQRTRPALEDQISSLPASEQLKGALRNALADDPQQRPSAQELYGELSQTPEVRTPA